MPEVDLEDLLPSVDIGQSDVDDPVEPPGPEQRIVEDVGPVGGADDLHVAGGGESIQLGQQLHEGPLDLAVSGGGDVETLGPDGVQFVDEDDARSLVFGELEQLADESGALSDVLLDQFGSDQPDEGRLGGVGHGLGHQGLPGSGRTDQQDALGGLDADLLIEFGPEERVLDGLPELHHLVLQASDVVVGDVGLVDDLGTRHDGIHGRGQDLHEGQGLLVEGDPGSGDEVVGRNVFGHGHDEVRAGRALHDHAVVGQHVPERSDDQRRALEPLQLVPEPGEVLLQSEEFTLGVALLGLGVLEVLHQPDVPLFEGDNLGLQVGHVVVIARHIFSVGVQ